MLVKLWMRRAGTVDMALASMRESLTVLGPARRIKDMLEIYNTLTSMSIFVIVHHQLRINKCRTRIKEASALKLVPF